MANQTTEHQGITITLDSDFYFRFTLDGQSHKVESVAAAKAQIDEYLSRKKKLNKVKLDWPLVGDNGEDYVLTGVHASSGNLLTKPVITGYSRPVLYLASAKDKVSQLVDLRKQAERLEKELRPSAIPKSQDLGLGYGRTEGYAEALAAWYEKQKGKP